MESEKICIIGLGYVGLPLAVAFGEKHKTIGFDISEERITDLKNGIDATLEVDSQQITSAENLQFTSLINDIRSCNVYIVTVPTPIDELKRPDLNPILSATELIGFVLSPQDLVIHESTVYPGLTEEECVPLLEQKSGPCFKYRFLLWI